MKLDLKKYNIQFDEDAHRYVLNGSVVPGVSSISGVLPKEWLAPWAAKMVSEAVRERWQPEKAYTAQEIDDVLHLAKASPNRRKDAAADKGTAAHLWFETFVKSGQEPALPTDPAILNCINRFKEWRDEAKPEWIASELVVASEQHQFAGKLDSLAVINGKTVLADWKTSSGIFPEFYIQTAGYYLALEEMGIQESLKKLGLPPLSERWILRFPKEGNEFEARMVPTDIVRDQKVFLAAMEIYCYIKSLEAKKSWYRK